jgi:Trypsin
MRSFCVALAIAAAFTGGQALAQHGAGQDVPTAPRPGIIASDDRVRIDDQWPPWDAIGHVNVGGVRRRGRCTGTLVAPDVVITAAHCVLDPWKKAPYPLRDIHFLAGVRGAAHKGHATAKCLRFPKGVVFVGPERVLPRRPAQQVPLQAFAQDAVAIVLTHKLAVAPVSLAKGVAARPGLALVHAAYPADRRLVTAQDVLAAAGRSRGRLVVRRLRHPSGQLGRPGVRREGRRPRAGGDHAGRGWSIGQRGSASFGVEGLGARGRVSVGRSSPLQKSTTNEINYLNILPVVQIEQRVPLGFRRKLAGHERRGLQSASYPAGAAAGQPNVVATATLQGNQVPVIPPARKLQ